jgi:hypothetical protein
MKLEAEKTNGKASNLPVPSEEEMRDMEDIDMKSRRRRLPTVRKLQLSGDLEHSRACVSKSINGYDNGNFKFNNGQISVFDTLMEAWCFSLRIRRRTIILGVLGVTEYACCKWGCVMWQNMKCRS